MSVSDAKNTACDRLNFPQMICSSYLEFRLFVFVACLDVVACLVAYLYVVARLNVARPDWATCGCIPC
jgi:hypothetical protein